MSEHKVTVVVLDETYGLDDAIKEKVGALYTCYVFDQDTGVHCCEVTPSFALEPFGFVTAKEIDDDLDSVLRSEMHANDSPVYMHCSAIDSLASRFKSVTTVELDDDKLDDDASNIALLAVAELQANPVHPPFLFTL